MKKACWSISKRRGERKEDVWGGGSGMGREKEEEKEEKEVGWGEEGGGKRES